MLMKAKELKGYKLKSLDGEIGKVKDFYFDDQYWGVRYLIVDTGSWLMERQVLISPYSLVAINEEEHHISVNLTKQRIEDSPPLESDKTVSQQYEESYSKYYGQPLYWGGSFMWGATPYIQNDASLGSMDHSTGMTNATGMDHSTRMTNNSGMESNRMTNTPDMDSTRMTNATGTANNLSNMENNQSWDPSLRSANVVRKYKIRATDGDLGHVEDFVIDDDNWAIRYFVVDTKDWWPAEKVLISPEWIEHIDWADSIVYVNVACDAILKSPEYTDEFLLTRDYETGLHEYYNREGYWVDQKKENTGDETQIR